MRTGMRFLAVIIAMAFVLLPKSSGPTYAETSAPEKAPAEEKAPAKDPKSKKEHLAVSDLPEPVQEVGRDIKRVAKELEKGTEKTIRAGKAAIKELGEKEPAKGQEKEKAQ